ncbi:hypothetical protein, partial [Sideroxydans sp. CL21]
DGQYVWHSHHGQYITQRNACQVKAKPLWLYVRRRTVHIVCQV